MAVVWFQTIAFLKDTASNNDGEQFDRLGMSSNRAVTDTEGPQLYLTDGPFGGPAFSPGRNNNDYLRADLGVSVGAEFRFAAWVKFGNSGTTQYILNGYSDNNVNHFNLLVNSSDQLAIYRGGTSLEISTWTFTPGRWYHLEVWYKIDNSAGDWDVWIDNTLILSGTGADDTLEGTGNANIRRLVYVGYENQACRWAMPMVWSSSGDAPTGHVGPHTTDEVRPNADTAQADFTPQGAGANYVEVDEAEADDDTTYNESGTSTDMDRLDCTALSVAFSTIWAVKALVLAKQTAPGGHTIKPGIYSGATESKPSSGQGVGVLYDYHEHLTTLNPADSLAWEVADVNAAQVQYEVV